MLPPLRAQTDQSYFAAGRRDSARGSALFPPWTRAFYHHYSRCTETTLAAVALRYPLLRRMWTLHVPNAFNGNDMLTVNTDQRCKTGIERSMVYLLRCRVVLRYHLSISAVAR